MAVTPDLTQRRTAGVAFEVERVAWPTPNRLELVGRWFGVRGRRFIRPTLHVDVDGERRRMLAVLDHKPWAVEDGEEWIAAFDWRGEPVDLTGSELTVGPDIAVELAPPGDHGAAGRRFARRPRADVLEDELQAARREARRLTRELHAVRAQHTADLNRRDGEHEAELERMREARIAAEQETERNVAALRSELESERRRAAELDAAVRKVREELAVSRAELAAQREGLSRERAAIAAEASAAAAADIEALRVERDAARRESAEARAERDASRRESAQARAERDSAIRERDAARQARNAFLARTRAEGASRARGEGGSRPRAEGVAEPGPESVPSRQAEGATDRPDEPAASGPTPTPPRRTVVRIPAEPSEEVEPPTDVTSDLTWHPEPSASLGVRIAAVGALIVLVVALVLLLAGTL